MVDPKGSCNCALLRRVVLLWQRIGRVGHTTLAPLPKSRGRRLVWKLAWGTAQLHALPRYSPVLESHCAVLQATASQHSLALLAPLLLHQPPWRPSARAAIGTNTLALWPHMPCCAAAHLPDLQQRKLVETRHAIGGKDFAETGMTARGWQHYVEETLGLTVETGEPLDSWRPAQKLEMLAPGMVCLVLQLRGKVSHPSR